MLDLHNIPCLVVHVEILRGIEAYDMYHDSNVTFRIMDSPVSLLHSICKPCAESVARTAPLIWVTLIISRSHYEERRHCHTYEVQTLYGVLYGYGLPLLSLSTESAHRLCNVEIVILGQSRCLFVSPGQFHAPIRAKVFWYDAINNCHGSLRRLSRSLEARISSDPPSRSQGSRSPPRSALGMDNPRPARTVGLPKISGTKGRLILSHFNLALLLCVEFHCIILLTFKLEVRLLFDLPPPS
ncbi:hypothetical protein QBC37DRAFT_478245 [Rhypophila decipiens]|uniref:Uncharacterized protein n=1 Tax=Rhypophila decipiens TaxID=261697 RepID=A0AAN6YMB4_9PEZI|nr:hypothetical protein QBC37DRAFT_478245 [Rhypophila decipiens]